MANPYFNAAYYLATNLDVLAAGYTVANAEQHYLQHGAAEALSGANDARKPAPWFDIQFYLTNYPDLLAGGITAQTAFEHFTTHGQFEGRSPANGLTVTDAKLKAYADANADLRTAFGITDTANMTDAQEKALTSHFYQYGYSEDRPGSPFESDTNPGQTFTLTEAIQDLVGTSGDDLFIAGVTGAANPTLNLGDKIDGGGGTDTIELYGANAAQFATANVKNVEIVKANASVDVSNNADVKEVALVNAAGGTVTLTKSQVAALEGKVTAAAAVAYSNVAGPADAATVAVRGAAVTGGVTIAGVESLTIDATGKNTLGNLTIAATETLTVKGEGSVSAAAVAAGVIKTVDATANNGGLTLDVSLQAANPTKINTGAGADEITVDYANLLKTNVVNLGEGSDTLAFAVTAVDLSTATLVNDKLAGVSNVETLKVNGALTFKADAALLSQNGFVINSTGAATLTNIANADTVTFGAVTNAAANTVAMELGQNTFSVALKGSATAASDVANVAVTGSSVVNVSSAGTAGVAQNVLAITTADNNLFNVSGSQDLKLTVTGAGGVTGQTVDASAFTGKLNVTATALVDTITGGSGADTIVGGLLGDKLSGGAGADKFVINGTVANVYTDSLAVAGGFDKITDFVAGTDKIALINTGTAVTGVTLTTVNVATADDLAGLLTAIGTQVAASAGAAAQAGLINVAAGTLAGTYVFVNDATNAAAATDTLIDVTGVTGTITAADFVFA